MALNVLVMAAGISPLIGGAETLASNLVIGLSAAGAEVHLLAGTAPAKRVIDAARYSGGTVQVAEKPSVPPAIMWENDCFWRSEELYRLLAEHRVDVVIALSHDTALSASIALAGRSDNDRPLLVACYSEISTEMYGVGQSRSSFIYNLREVDCIVALSEKYRSVAIRYGVHSDLIFVNPLGVDRSRFAQAADDGVKSDNALHFACPSRFTPRKGQLDLLEAWRIYKASGGEGDLTLCGDVNESDPDYMEQLVEQASALAVSIRTDLPNTVIPEFLKAVDVVVQPSHYEGLGYSALEAMAIGKATVLTAVDGFNEFAEDHVNCLSVPAHNPAALARAMTSFMTSSALRTKLGAAAATTVENKFDLVKNSRRLIQDLETFAARARA